MCSMPEGPRIDKPRTGAEDASDRRRRPLLTGRFAPHRLREPSALIVLREAQMARDRVVHRGEEAVNAPDEMAAADIGLQKVRRELEKQAPGRDRDAAQLEVMSLLVGVPIELVELVAERAHGEMVDHALQALRRDAGVQLDPVMNERRRVAASVATVEPYRSERIGPGMRPAFAGEDLGDPDAEGGRRRLARREQGADLALKLRRHDLVGIEVEEPFVPALLL